MKNARYLLIGMLVVFCSSLILAQLDFERKVVKVPKVDPSAIVLDGVMDEAAWQNAGEANLITNSGYEFYGNYYYRDLPEPDYNEYYARMLWSQDTLFLFIHIDEVVNDSSDLFWDGKWTGDQLFVSLSNRLGIDYDGAGRYNGNAFTVPDGPYYFVILGDQLTINGGEPFWVPEEWRKFADDTMRTVDPSTFARMAVKIDKANGIWDIEMAIYNPKVTVQSSLGFNIGGSQGSTASNTQYSDAYAYYTWQANVPDEPFTEPPILDVLRNQGLWGDPGTFNLATSQCFAILEFEGDNEIFVRKEVQVPKVDPSAIVLDGVMDEAAWQNAGEANLITNSGYEFYGNYYYRDLPEPDYNEYYARMLWSQDTLFLFIHIDEVVNDSSDLFWDGKWTGDQLFVSLSNRLGIDYDGAGRYNGNAFTVPDGPYYFVILGDQLTINGGEPFWVPEEWRKFADDTMRTVDPSTFARMAVKIDKANGIWDIEMAIYNPKVTVQSSLGFNIGGSQGSTASNTQYSDAYAYYTWQANVPDEPFTEPPILDVLRNQGLWGDPGTFNLATSQCFAVLNFVNDKTVGVQDYIKGNSLPVDFSLDQNFPNPFNPSTTIRINVSELSPISLKIYNSIGQLVATLIDNQVLSKGTHLVNWKAESLSSGVYFYSLEAGGKLITKKMMLIK